MPLKNHELGAGCFTVSRRHRVSCIRDLTQDKLFSLFLRYLWQHLHFTVLCKVIPRCSM